MWFLFNLLGKGIEKGCLDIWTFRWVDASYSKKMINKNAISFE